jgi:hypothetical protein
VVRQPGPLHAFYQRLRGRRGSQIAMIAAARKLAVLFWCLLSRDEDYPHQQPSLTAKTLRLLEILAGAPDTQVHAERGVGHQAGDAQRRAKARRASRDLLHADGPRLASSRPGIKEGGRECDTAARITKAQGGQSRAADHEPLTYALGLVIDSRPTAA